MSEHTASVSRTLSKDYFELKYWLLLKHPGSDSQVTKLIPISMSESESVRER